jgi:hypothetical protein
VAAAQGRADYQYKQIQRAMQQFYQKGSSISSPECHTTLGLTQDNAPDLAQHADKQTNMPTRKAQYRQQYQH